MGMRTRSNLPTRAIAYTITGAEDRKQLTEAPNRIVNTVR